jgi:hypothetical protein
MVANVRRGIGTKGRTEHHAAQEWRYPPARLTNGRNDPLRRSSVTLRARSETGAAQRSPRNDLTVSATQIVNRRKRRRAIVRFFSRVKPTRTIRHRGAHIAGVGALRSAKRLPAQRVSRQAGPARAGRLVQATLMPGKRPI